MLAIENGDIPFNIAIEHGNNLVITLIFHSFLYAYQRVISTHQSHHFQGSDHDRLQAPNLRP